MNDNFQSPDRDLKQTIIVVIALTLAITSAFILLWNSFGTIVNVTIAAIATLLVLVPIAIVFTVVPGAIVAGAIETVLFSKKQGFSGAIAVLMPVLAVNLGIALGGMLRSPTFSWGWTIDAIVSAIALTTVAWKRDTLITKTPECLDYWS